MLPYASRIEAVDKLMRQAITPRTLNKIVDLIPDQWLNDESVPGIVDDDYVRTDVVATEETAPENKREIYRKFLINRLADTTPFVKQAIEERRRLGYGNS